MIPGNALKVLKIIYLKKILTLFVTKLFEVLVH